MAKNGNNTNFLKMTSKNINAKWLQSAMKSIGISTKNAIQSITPNIFSTVTTGAEIGRDFVTYARQNLSSIDKVSNTLRGNRYVQYAEKAYKNALTDIKSGNFNNEDRATNAMMGAMGFDMSEDGDDGYSFGDDGGEGGGNTYNVYQDTGTSQAMIRMTDQIAKGQVAQVKMQKASMDAFIAVQSTSMHQMAKNHAEVISHLSNIHSELSSINAFNSENMSKFIEGSLAFYEKVGKMTEAEAKQDNTIRAKDVFASDKGGLNLRTYKDYIKQNFKKSLGKTTFGLVASLADNDEMLEYMVSNPVGMFSEALIGWMMPKMLTSTLQTLETTYNNAMPKLLARVAALADTKGTDFVSSIKRMVGETFGARDERVKSFRKADVNRDATPFDGETKHAITEIITKELREQTSLLKVIASKGNKNALQQARDMEEFYDDETGKYTNRNKINRNIAEDIQNSIVAAFNDTKFGESVNQLVADLKMPSNPNDKRAMKRYNDTREEYDKTIRELFVKLERDNRKLELPVVLEIINSLGAHQSVKSNLYDYVSRMYANDKTTLDSADLARYNAQAERRDAISRITESRGVNNLNASMFMDMDTDEAIDRIFGYGKHAVYKGKGRRLKSAAIAYQNDTFDANDQAAIERGYSELPGAQSPITNVRTSLNNLKGNLLGAINNGIVRSGDNVSQVTGTIKGVASGAVNTVKAFLAGDAMGLIGNAAKFVENTFNDITKKANRFFFGEEDEEGKKKGGILSDLYNDVRGFFNDTIDKVKVNFKTIGSSIKDGIMLKLFGKVRDPETGEYKEEPRDPNGEPPIFERVKGIFTAGITGWTKSFFGDDNVAEHQDEVKSKAKEVMGYLKENAGAGATGAAVGAVTGISMGGLLGSVIGGPFIGAGIGAIGGFLSKSKKFQSWLFGEVDENGEEVKKGLISQSTQKFFKDNKDYLVGSTAVGAVGGAITGGGLLGTLVGGPVGGAIMGLAGGVLTKSKLFQDFWLGNPEKGKKGFMQGIKDAWSSHFSGSKGGDKTLSEQGAEAVGMAGTGAIAGGVLGALMGGPIVGAVAGLTLGIASQGKNLKEFFLGKEDGLDLGDGTKTKRHGVFGVIANYINANILGPLTNEFKFIAEDALNVLEHKILAPVGWAAEFVADKLGGWVSGITNTVGGILMDIGSSIKKGIGDLLSPFTKAAGEILSKGVHIAYSAISTAAKTPGALIAATIKAFNLKEKFDNLLPVRLIRGFIGDVKDIIKTGIKSGIKMLFDGLFGILKLPFKALGGIATAASWVGKKIGGAVGGIQIGDKTIGERIKNSGWAEKFREEMTNRPGLFGDLGERMRLSKEEYEEKKKEIRERYESNKELTANAGIIAKASKGQFGEDTEQARRWLKLNNPLAYAKLKGDSKDVRLGLTTEQLKNANVDKLPNEDKQVYFLQNISDAVKAIVANIKGESSPINNSAQAANAMSALNAMSTDDLRAKAREHGIQFDETTTDDELRTRIGNVIEGTNGREIKAPTIGSQVGNNIARPAVNAVRAVKSGVKKSRFLGALRHSYKYLTADPVTKLIMNATGGKYDEDSEDARNYIKQHNTRAYLKLIEMTGSEDATSNVDVDEVQDAAVESGETVEQHSIGGFIKSGLSLVGEAGAELINVGKTGVEVLSNKATKAASKAVKSGKRTFSSFFSKSEEKESGDGALEEASDENRQTRLANARQAIGAAKTSAEHQAAVTTAAQILNEARNDLANDNQKKALDNARTASEIRKEKEEADAKKEQKEYQAEMIKATKGTGESVNNFKKGWDAIFSKNGLITAGALLIGGWLIKNFPGLMGSLINGIGNIASTIGTFIGTLGGDALKDASDTEKHKMRTNGNTMEEQLNYEVDEIKKGNVFTDNMGRATHNTEGRLKLAGAIGKGLVSGSRSWGGSFLIPGSRLNGALNHGLNKIGNGVGKVGSKVGDVLFSKSTTSQVMKSGEALADARYLYERGVTGVEGLYDDVVTGKDGIVTKAVKKVGNLGDDMAKAVANKAAKNDGLLSSLCKYIDNFFNMISEKFAAKTGEKVGSGIFKYGPSTIISALKSSWDNIAEKMAAKISAVTGAHVTGAAVTAGLTEVAFASLNALNGLSGTAKLFQVAPDKVDGTMKLIASIFGAITGTLVGSIIDVIFSILGGVMGVDLLHSVAVALYTVLVGKDSDKAKALNEAQSEWKDAYIEERDGKLLQQYQTQKKAGIIGENVTYEEFVAGLETGKYQASYDSFLDWNTQKNGSIMDKAATGVGTLVKGAAHNLGKFWNGDVSYTDDKGNTYKKNQDGTYQVTGADGSDLGYVSAESIDTSTMTENKSSGFGAKVMEGAKSIGGFLKKHKSTIIGAALGGPVGAIAGHFLGKLFNKEKDVFYDADGSFYGLDGQHYTANGTKLDKVEDTKLQYMVNSGQLVKGTYTFEKSAFEEFAGKAKEGLSNAWKEASKNLGELWGNIKDGASKVTSFLSEHKAGVVGALIGGPLGALAMDRLFGKKKKCWYDTDGSYYTSDGKHFSANGDELEQIDKEVLMAKITTGQVKEGTFIAEKSDGQIMIEKGKEALKGAWEKVSPMLSGLWDGFKTYVGGPLTKLLGGGFKVFKDDITSRFKMLMNVCWIDSDGSYYVQTGDSYSHYNTVGDSIGEGIEREKVEQMIASGVLVKGEIPLAQRFGVKFNASIALMKDNWGKAVGLFNDVAGVVGNVASKFFNKVKEKGGDILGFWSGLIGAKTKRTAWYYNDGSYYVQMGDKYTYYNPLGDIIEENIPKDDVQRLIASGLLTEGEAQVKDNRISNAAKSIGEKAKSLMDSGINAAKDMWSKFKGWMSGGNNGGSGVGGYGKAIGGFGESVNGASYFSQNDPRWAGKAYNMGADNATMGNAGCGPTAMAMAVNTAKARQEVTPMQMANMAKMTGNRDETGTNSRFIGQAAMMSGLASSQMNNPSGTDISQNVAMGNPVVLLGKGGSTYTNSGHYVVAVGQDSNGNILINDPRGKTYSKSVSPNQLSGNTISAWSVGNMNPRAYGQAKIKGSMFGGRGSIPSSKIIAIAQAEVGYIEKDSNSNLDVKTGSGSKNFTKYARDVGHANGLAWCATFVTWVFQQAAGGDKVLASNTLYGATTASCKANVDKFKAAGRWLEAGQTPKPGDVIFYKKSHTGVVVGVNGATVYTIEGNTSGDNAIERNGGMVALKTRTVGDAGIWGWGSTDVTVDANLTDPSTVSNNVSGLNLSGATTGATAGMSSANESKWGKLTSFMSSLMSEAGSRALAGDFNNTDFSSIINQTTMAQQELTASELSGTGGAPGASTAVGYPSSVSSGQKIPGATSEQLIKTDLKKLPKLDQYSIEKIISTWLGDQKKPSVISTALSKDIKDAQDASGISALALLGIATQESGLGTSRIAKDKNNFWGWGAANKNPHGLAKGYDSPGAAFKTYASDVDRVFWNKRNQKSILDMSGLGGGQKMAYCTLDDGKTPSTTWGPSIGRIMEKFLGYGLTASDNTGGSGIGIKKVGGFGNASQISHRDRNRIRRATSTAKKSTTGGFGTSISTGDLLSSTTKSNIANYITTTPNNTTEEILINALEILSAIAINTGTTSSKLDMLNNLKTQTVNGGTNNIVLTGNGNTAQNTNNASALSNMPTKNDMTARAIAKGGY